MQAHLASVLAVAEGQADIASIDAVNWRLAQEYESFAGALRVLEWTAATPGLPLITSNSLDEVLIFTAVEFAIDGLSNEDRSALGVLGLERIKKSRYLGIENPDLPECDARLK